MLGVAMRVGSQESLVADRVVDLRRLHPCSHDWARLDSLQGLTRWRNVTPKVADAQQSDRGATKG